MLKRIQSALLLVVLLTFAILVVAGCGGGGSGSNTFDLESQVVGDTYRISVGLPPGYDPNGSARYPVIYLLDGNWSFNAGVSAVRSQVGAGRMEPVIVVGICPIQALQSGYTGTSPSRCRDLTPTVLAGYPGSGGAEYFAAFLRTELIPHIDANYLTRSDPADRCLAGHSLGGLFTWYGVFHLNDVFQKFLPASASIWWDNRAIYNDEGSYASGHTDLTADVYTTVSTGEGGFMVTDRDELVNRLNNRSYSGLSIQTATYDGIPHEQSFTPALPAGLAALF